MKVVKNKVAPPFREAEFDIMYGTGISKEGDLIDLGVDKGMIEKSGAWFSYKGERMGQGRENAKQFLVENADIRLKVEEELRRALNIPLNAVAEAVNPSPDVTSRAKSSRAGVSFLMMTELKLNQP